MSDNPEFKSIEWELLGDVVAFSDIDDCPALTAKPSLIKVSRDELLKIKVDMTGKSNQPLRHVVRNLKAGEQILGADLTGWNPRPTVKITLHDLLQKGGTSKLHSADFSIDAVCHRISQEAMEAEPSPIFQVYEYLLGCPAIDLGRDTTRITNERIELIRGSPNVADLFNRSVKGISHKRDHVRINNQFGEIIFSSAEDPVCPENYRPCYIEFFSEELRNNEDYRNSWVEALGFAFGKRMAQLGYGLFGPEMKLIKKMSYTPFSPNLFQEMNCQCMPPTTITTVDDFMDESVVELLTERFLEKRDKYKLSDVMWNLWIARASPIGYGFTNYSSSLETLINAWSGVEDKAIRSYVSTDEFSKIVEPKIKEISKEVSTNDPAWCKILQNLGHANRIGVGDKYKNFFSSLGLKTGKVEDAAIRARHKYAHGGTDSSKDFRSLIIKGRAFDTLVQRTILAVLGCSETYIDYSTYGFPERPIGDCLGGPLGDGVID